VAQQQAPATAFFRAQHQHQHQQQQQQAGADIDPSGCVRPLSVQYGF